MDDDDLVARVLLRAAHADTAALLRPGMLEKLACALRALDIEHSYFRLLLSLNSLYLIYYCAGPNLLAVVL